MKKSDFYCLIKELPKKPDSIAIHGKMVCVCITGDRKQVLVICKTEENAAKEMHKFNRWLSEALESIHPSETQWMPEEDKLTSLEHELVKIELCEEQEEHEFMGLCGGKLQNSLHQAKIKTVKSADGGKRTIFKLEAVKKINEVKKQKSPAKIFVRATLNILKHYDCFDSAKNPHWSNKTKKQKKEWARNFGIEMMECWIEQCGMDLASDDNSSTGFNSCTVLDIDYYLSRKENYNAKAIDQLKEEMDYASIEEYIEESLNCLW